MHDNKDNKKRETENHREPVSGLVVYYLVLQPPDAGKYSPPELPQTSHLKQRDMNDIITCPVARRLSVTILPEAKVVLYNNGVSLKRQLYQQTTVPICYQGT